MRRRLPPLHALRAFEAAARHLSFQKAAGELFITPGGVSHHVRHLEAELGEALFVRGTREIRLTTKGAQLLTRTTRALDLLAEGCEEVRARMHDTIRVSLLSSFATHWLLPRLPGFYAAHPNIELILETTTRHADFSGQEIDLALRYGAGPWPDVAARLIITERLAPVCAPSLMQRGPPIAAPADLLLHIVLLAWAAEPFEWLPWSAAHGVDWSAARTRMLHDYNIVIEATVAGQGVAMGRETLTRDLVGRGRLIEPLGPAVPLAGIGHWVVTPLGPLRPAVAVLSDWLAEQACMGEPNTPLV